MDSNKRNQIIFGIVAFLTLLVSYKILRKAINVGTTIFLIIVVILMIYFLGRM